MTRIGVKNGKVLLKNGLICAECCNDTPSCDCGSTVNIGGNSRTIEVEFEGGTSCSICISAAPFLSKVGTGGCNYSGFYTFTGCYGANCQLQITFSLSNFPGCECNGNGDYCDYEIVAWETVFGNCVATSLTLTDFC